MERSYITYSLIIICGLLAFNLYRIRKDSAVLSDTLTRANEEFNAKKEQKAECESQLSAQKDATKETKEILTKTLADIETVKTELDACEVNLKKKIEEDRKKEEEEKLKAAEEAKKKAEEEKKVLEEAAKQKTGQQKRPPLRE